MNNQSQILSVKEKVGYSLGDLAANLVFQTMVTFIAYYYTDVYKLEASTAQWVIATCGIIGGVLFAPIMGAIADRTRTRWGRYRPWILWTSIPFGVMVLLTFTTPDVSYDMKVVYAFATYLALVTLYTANNLPYSSLSGVLTGNMSQRNSLSAYRFVAVMVAQFTVQVLLRPIVLILGDGDEAVGFEKIMMIFAVVGVIFFFITFFTTRERVIEKPGETSTIRQDLGDLLLRNIPWVILLCVTILVFTNLALKGGTYVYYFKYYASQAAITAFLSDIGFTGLIASIQSVWPNFAWPEDPDASAFALFNGAGIILMIVGIGFARPLADRFGKRNIFGGFLFLSALPLIAFAVVPRESIGTMFVLQILHGFFYGVTIPLLWAMTADVADYSEWRNHRRATGIIFSAMILGLKGGLTLGGTLVVTFLAAYGYEAGVADQTAESILGIKLTMSVYAAIPFLIACGLLFFYRINKSLETEIEQELGSRRAQPMPEPDEPTL
jgi:Na+/melibiose symporter-like transporter